MSRLQVSSMRLAGITGFSERHLKILPMSSILGWNLSVLSVTFPSSIGWKKELRVFKTFASKAIMKFKKPYAIDKFGKIKFIILIGLALKKYSVLARFWECVSPVSTLDQFFAFDVAIRRIEERFWNSFLFFPVFFQFCSSIFLV